MPISSIQVLTLVFQRKISKYSETERIVQWSFESPYLDAQLLMFSNIWLYYVYFFFFLNNLKVSCVDHCNSSWTPKSKIFSSITTITSHVRILTIIPQYISSNTHLIFQFFQLFQKYVLWLYFSFEEDQIKDHTLYFFFVSLVSFILE